MHLGLIGGIGPAVTCLYYTRLCEIAKTKGFKLELTLANCDMPEFMVNFASANKDVQARIYCDLTKGLRAAGAECVALISIGGSFCLDEFIANSGLPVVDILTPLKQHLEKMHYKKLGLIGTKIAMETKIYGVTDNVEWLIPEGANFENTHNSYVELANAGVATPKNRDDIISACNELIDRGAEAIVLGGTDLFLAFDDTSLSIGVIDCAEVHIKRLAELAAPEGKL